MWAHAGPERITGTVRAMVQPIEISAPEGLAEAYLAGSGGPGVLFYIDAIGLRPRIAEMVDRIASWGYVVLAPNVFYRDGTAEQLAPRADLRVPENRAAYWSTSGAMERVRAYTPERAAADAEAFVAELLERAGGGPIGTTGYCMGARLATRLAGQFPELVKAVGGWHGGGLVADGPDSPHLAIEAATAQFAFGHADHDRSMPPEAIEALGATLAVTGRPFLNEVFAGAEHGYTMADTSAFHAEATERHFTELGALLARTLR